MVPVAPVDLEAAVELRHDVVEVVSLYLLACLVEELQFHLVGFFK